MLLFRGLRLLADIVCFIVLSKGSEPFIQDSKAKSFCSKAYYSCNMQGVSSNFVEKYIMQN